MLDRVGKGPLLADYAMVPFELTEPGALFHLLKNRTFLGEIVHKGRCYPGAHPAIVDPIVFETVQRALADRAASRGERVARSSAAPLQGRLHDQTGAIMSPTFSQGRTGRRYRYYVSAPVQQGRSTAGPAIRRIGAPALEQLVLQRCSMWLDWELDWPTLRPALVRVELAQDSIAVGSRTRRDAPLKRGEAAAMRFVRDAGQAGAGAHSAALTGT